MGKQVKRVGTSKRAAAVKHVLLRLNPDGWRALKFLSIERDQTIQDLMLEATNDLLIKNGKKPVAKSGLAEE